MFKTKRLKALIASLVCLIIVSGQLECVFANHTQAFYQQQAQLERDFNNLLGQTQTKLILSGFKKLKTEYLSDYNTNAVTYEHIKSGAQVLVIDNEDEEKFFTIAFKTEPKDDTGANHVFEHTTLQGSKNYPVKSMLTTLGSKSMATFFNAATADDFTFYPFGSINEKDYYNLMRIYLDGIFYPMVLTDENVFKRDGVRLDLVDGKLSYNGVVYNEMKNASSNPKAILYNSIKKSLYPQTYYKYNAGGTPEAIPNLTYADVLKLHRQNYHPSNSLTILYGKQDLIKSLELLNSYFKNFDRQDVAFEVAYQKPFSKLNKYYSTYPVSADNTTAASIMSLNYVIPESHNYEDTMVDLILLDLLMLGSTNSVKQMVLESGLTSSLNISNNSMQVNQGAISFYSMDVDDRYEDVFVQVIESAIKKMKAEGFDKKYIEAVFNAYQYEEITSNIGPSIGYKAGLSAIAGWMYYNNPTTMLNNRQMLNKIKRKLNDKLLNKAIDELFLENNFKSLVVIKPDKNYESKQTKMQEEKINAISEGLSQQQKNIIAEQTNAFYKWQNTPDTEQSLNTLPKLELSDISMDKKTIEYSIPIDIDGAKLIQTYMDTKGVSNILLSFDGSVVPQQQLQYLQLMTYLFGNIPTKNLSMDQLIQQQLICFGNFDVTLECVNKEEKYYPRYNVSIKTLHEESALKLTKEILINSNFNDKELVRKILKKIKMNYQNSLSELSVPIAESLAQAMVSEQGKLSDYVQGYEFYKFVVNLQNNLDNNWETILNNIEQARDIVLNANNLVIGYTNTEDQQQNFIKNIKPLIASMGTQQYKKQILKFRDYGDTIAVISKSSTLSVNQVANIKDVGYPYSANMSVLSSIVSKGYLWPSIREKGGAYHTALNINKNGCVRVLSYADPNFIDTIRVYQNIPLFIESLSSIKQKDLDGFIINAAANIDNVLQDYNLWNYGVSNYISSYNLDNIYKQKKQILDTKVEDILKYAQLFKKLNSNSKYVIVGNNKIIIENKQLFDEIIDFTQ